MPCVCDLSCGGSVNACTHERSHLFALLFNRRPKIDGAPPKLQIMGQTLLGESNPFKLVFVF
jgi:hypothetical protein